MNRRQLAVAVILGVAPGAAAHAAPGDAASVDEVAKSRGFLFYPSASTAPSGSVRFAIGGSYDAIDPQVMYGVSARLPQLTLDVQGALGKGFSLEGHFNTMLVTTEALVGVGYAWRVRRWSFEVSTSVGLYVGRLGSFGFDAWLLAPEVRPEVTVGYDFGHIAVSLRGSLFLMGPERAIVGDVSGGLDNSNPFVGHSEMIHVENTTRGGSVWYFGAGLLTTRAYYALWLLFPDSPSLYTYPRIVVGYEF